MGLFHKTGKVPSKSPRLSNGVLHFSHGKPTFEFLIREPKTVPKQYRQLVLILFPNIVFLLIILQYH